MTLPKERIYTAEDYWNLPEGHRAELIDGKLYDIAPPSYIHQKLVKLFHLVLSPMIMELNFLNTKMPV
ncbi:MAG: hypothetical protein SPG59_03640 [Blautia sp.]|nr:hypothetical protein [Blautia sp.]